MRNHNHTGIASPLQTIDDINNVLGHFFQAIGLDVRWLIRACIPEQVGHDDSIACPHVLFLHRSTRIIEQPTLSVVVFDLIVPVI